MVQYDLCIRIEYVYNTYMGGLVEVAKNFIKPEQLKSNEKRTPVSARVRESIHEDLKSLSDEYALPISVMVEHAIEAYVEFAKSSSKKTRKKK